MRIIGTIAAMGAVLGCGAPAKQPVTPPPAPAPKVAPAAAKPDPKAESIRLSNEGFEALSEGKYGLALAKLQQSVAKDDQNGRAHQGIGQIYAHRRMWQDAAASLTKAVESSPRNGLYRLQLGIALFEANHPKQARVQFEKTVALIADTRAYWYLGRIHDRRGEPNKAAAAWRKGIKANPLFGPNYVAAGALYLSWEIPAAAIAILEPGSKQVKSAGPLSDLFYYLGLAYTRVNRFSDAVRAFKTTLAHDPDSASTRFQLGLAQLANRNYKAAQHQLSLALKAKRPIGLLERSIAQRALLRAHARQTMPRPGPAKPTTAGTVSFDIVVPTPSGTLRSPRELRLLSKRYLGKRVTVKGVVTWAYNCATTPRTGFSLRQWKRKIKNNPNLCWKPHFRLGDGAGTPPRLSITIADVPRPLRIDELKFMRADELKRYPTPVNVSRGDIVTLTGTWKRRSHGGFTDSGGLLEYESIKFHDPHKQRTYQRKVRRWHRKRARWLKRKRSPPP